MQTTRPTPTSLDYATQAAAIFDGLRAARVSFWDAATSAFMGAFAATYGERVQVLKFHEGRFSGIAFFGQPVGGIEHGCVVSPEGRRIATYCTQDVKTAPDGSSVVIAFRDDGSYPAPTAQDAKAVFEGFVRDCMIGGGKLTKFSCRGTEAKALGLTTLELAQRATSLWLAAARAASSDGYLPHPPLFDARLGCFFPRVKVNGEVQFAGDRDSLGVPGFEFSEDRQNPTIHRVRAVPLDEVMDRIGQIVPNGGTKRLSAILSEAGAVAAAHASKPMGVNDPNPFLAALSCCFERVGNDLSEFNRAVQYGRDEWIAVWKPARELMSVFSQIDTGKCWPALFHELLQDCLWEVAKKKYQTIAQYLPSMPFGCKESGGYTDIPNTRAGQFQYIVSAPLVFADAMWRLVNQALVDGKPIGEAFNEGRIEALAIGDKAPLTRGQREFLTAIDLLLDRESVRTTVLNNNVQPLFVPLFRQTLEARYPQNKDPYWQQDYTHGMPAELLAGAIEMALEQAVEIGNRTPNSGERLENELRVAFDSCIVAAKDGRRV